MWLWRIHGERELPFAKPLNIRTSSWEIRLTVMKEEVHPNVPNLLENIFELCIKARNRGKKEAAHLLKQELEKEVWKICD